MKNPSRPARTPASFVGRKRELDRLAAEIDQMAAGLGRVVLVTGEAGIGKTWLARAALASAQDGLADLDVRWARCSDAAGAPAYWPWRQLLGPGFDEAWGEPDDAGDLDPFERLHGMTRCIAAIGLDHPLALAIDDLQWADEGSLLLLDVLSREIESSRVIVLATVRDGVDGEALPAMTSLRSQRTVRRLPLPGFAEPETRRLAELLVGEKVGVPTVAALRRLTGGNPYFLGEILRSSTPADLARLTEGDSAAVVPSGVEELIARRLEACDAGTRAMLEVAAVIGPSFPLAWLSDLAEAGEPPKDRLLSQAIDVRLVEPAEEAAHLRFVHGLVRSATLSRIPAGRRARLHGRVGIALEEARAGGAAVDEAALAHHFVAAAILPEFAEAALRHARLAGDEASHQHAHELAIHHYSDALAVLEAAPADIGAEQRTLERAELLVGLGRARAYAGRPDAEAALDEAESRAGGMLETGRHDRAARILAFASIVRCEALSPATAPECRTALARGERALGALGSGMPALRARLLAALTPAFRFETSGEGVRTMATEAADLAAASGEPALAARATAALHFALLDQHSAAERLRFATRLLVGAEKAGDDRFAADARFWRYLDLIELGRADDAETELLRLEHLADRLGEPRRRYQALYLRAGLDIHQCRFDRAEQNATRALDLGMSMGIGDAELTYLTAISVVCFVRNDLARIAEIHGEITERRTHFPQAHHGSPILLAWQGHARSAQDDLATALEGGLDAIPRGPDWLGTMQTLAWSAIELDEQRLCRSIYERLRRHAGRTIVHHLGAAIGGSVDRLLANLATRLGRFEEANAYFREASVLAEASQGSWDRLFLPVEQATLRLATGADRDEPDVLRLLMDSLDRARETGAARVVQQVRDLHPALADEADARARAAAPNRFQRCGSGWKVAFRTHECELPDGRGLHLIAALLRRPGQEILATDLVAEITGETGVPVETARQRVTQRIRSVVERLRVAHAPLAAHLATHLRTGKYCSYLPRAEDGIDWELDPGPESRP